MAVFFDAADEPLDASLGDFVLCFCKNIRDAAPGPDKLVVKRVEANLLFSFGQGWQTRASLVLYDNSEKPTLSGMRRDDFERRNRIDFREILAFLVTEAKLLASGNVP